MWAGHHGDDDAETPRQTLGVLRGQSSLEMSTLWRALHADLQAWCFKPVRAPRLTAENRLARLNFCRDVLQRVGVLRSKRHLKPVDLTRVVFSDEKFFRWKYQGPRRTTQFGWSGSISIFHSSSSHHHIIIIHLRFCNLP